MKYYRVKPQYDNRVRHTRSNRYHNRSNGVLIGKELYTPSEFKKLAICPAWFEVVEISKQDVYTLFGARFESRTAEKRDPAIEGNDQELGASR